MEEKSLSIAFGDTFKEEVIGCISNIAEVGLDSIMEDGTLKELPIVSTVAALYKIGNSIKDRHNLKKLALFLDEINQGIADDQKREEYVKKFKDNEKFRNQEIEYLLILIDRYVGYDKPRLLAKLYLAYLNEDINWDTFAEFSEIIDRLMRSDYRCLFEFMCHGGVKINESPKINIASVLRLLSVGFVRQQAGIPVVRFDDPESQKVFDYYITEYGRLFTKVFEKELRYTYRSAEGDDK